MRRLAVWRDAWAETLAHARSNPLRTGLAALATGVAVATIALVLTGLQGVERYARETSAKTFGSDSFVITRLVTGTLNRRELADKLARNPDIINSDARFLDRWAGGRVIYAPTAQRAADVVAGGRKFENAAINGTASTLYDIRTVELAQGRFIDRTEDQRGAQVVVLGWDVAQTLFPDTSPIGQTVRIALRGFTVIGVQARQGTAGGVSLDRYVWMPLGAYERAFGAPDSLDIFARAAGATSTIEAEDHARITMRARRHLQPGAPADFDLLTPEAARSFVFTLSQRVGAAGPPISLMALLAAILVVTNTALVSVTARTREIGIRRAVGASRGRIVGEVLAEAAFIGLLGGLAGLLVAGLVLRLAQGPAGIPLPLEWSTIAWSLGAAVTSGLAAGWYPARLAARIDIIDALHAE
ncbi:MAG: ABC transporter permease [Acidobacteriota bacterium]|nr:ABC transporter permease [Acidobacteriota bacterium]